MSFDSTVLFEEMDLWNEYFYVRWPKIIVLGPDHTSCTNKTENYQSTCFRRDALASILSKNYLR